MTIRIEIYAETAEEAMHEMQVLAGTKNAQTGSGCANPGIPAAEDVPTAPVTMQLAEPLKRGRGRPRKNAEPETAPEPEQPAQAISETPEDRKDPEVEEAEEVEVEDADEPEEASAADDLFGEDDAEEPEEDMIDGYAITDAGLKAAMNAHVAKFGMQETQKHLKTLLGHDKYSTTVAAGPEAIAEAIRRFSTAVKTGKAA